MQIYYFTRTGRSLEIAKQLAKRYHTTERKIEDHKNWSGNINFIKAAFMSLREKTIQIEYIEPDRNDEIIVVFPLWADTLPPAIRTFVEKVGKNHIIAVVTSSGSTLKNQDGFKKVISLVGKHSKVPEI